MTISRSLLDPPAARGRTGLARDMEYDGPSMAEVMCTLGWGVSSGDDGRARQALEALRRTAVGYSGVLGGFALKPEMASSVLDKARLPDGPFARANWRPTKFREFWLPTFNELSRVNGSRWGGVQGQIGLSETAQMNQTQPAIGRIDYSMCRLTVFSQPMSRDLLADSELVAPMLDYVARSEIRFMCDAAMIGNGSSSSNTGSVPGVTPEGVIGGNSTVAVPRTTSDEIKAADVDLLWSSVAGPNKIGAVWHASDEVIQYIDQTAQSGGWAESLYFPQGKAGNEYPLLKGRPLIYCENCSALGTPGDLLVADWNDYYLYFHKVTPEDSGLAFNVLQPTDKGHLGGWGLPENSVEARMSDQFMFLNDLVVFMWKLRLDGHFCWSTSMANVNGSKVGPGAYLV